MAVLHQADGFREMNKQINKQTDKHRMRALHKTDRWQKKIKQHNSLLMISCRAACRSDVQRAHHKIITARRALAPPRLIGALSGRSAGWSPFICQDVSRRRVPAPINCRHDCQLSALTLAQRSNANPTGWRVQLLEQTVCCSETLLCSPVDKGQSTAGKVEIPFQVQTWNPGSVVLWFCNIGQY